MLTGLLQQTMMISSAYHHDLSLVCQAQTYQSVSQQKKWTSVACMGDAGSPIAPPLPTGLRLRNIASFHLRVSTLKIILKRIWSFSWESNGSPDLTVKDIVIAIPTKRLPLTELFNNLREIKSVGTQKVKRTSKYSRVSAES